jgi:ribosome-associated heat shock protein Hsp15
MDAEGATVRLDRWLWAARFYRTRTLAAEAIDGGKVEVNGQRAKRSKVVRVGDRVRVRRGEDVIEVIVEALADRRGPAATARLLYRETEESRQERERRAALQRRLGSGYRPPPRRPSSKERRVLRRLKGLPD